MEIYMFYCLLIFNIITCAITVTLPTYNVREASCGDTIYPTGTEGVLIFDADVVDWKHKKPRRDCEITLSPNQLKDSSNDRMLFYFTKFNLGPFCSDRNLTIYEKRSYTTRVTGTLCGHNTSLENGNSVFVSKRKGIRLLFRWSEYGTRDRGSFNMTFIAFYKGPCVTTKHYKCSNDRCIDSDISCQGDINACGTGLGVGSNCTIDMEIVERILNTIVETIKDFGIVLAIGIGLVIAKKLVYDRCRAKYGSISNFPIVRSFCKDSNSTPERRNSAFLSYDDHQRRASLDNISLQLSTHSEPQATPTHADDPPTYDTLNGEFQRNSSDRNFPYTSNPDSYPVSYNTSNVHSVDDDSSQTSSSASFTGEPAQPSAPPPPSMPPPPPSYDEVMSNNDRYMKD